MWRLWILGGGLAVLGAGYARVAYLNERVESLEAAKFSLEQSLSTVEQTLERQQTANRLLASRLRAETERGERYDTMREALARGDYGNEILPPEFIAFVNGLLGIGTTGGGERGESGDPRGAN